MYNSVNEFIEELNSEVATTQKLLDVLTDLSLQQEVSSEGRTLGRLAWHIVTSFPVTVFGIAEIQDVATIPTSADEIAESFRKISASILDVVRANWADATLKEVHNVFGRDMPLELSLPLVIKHLIHHRGQMTVLMRQAGLKVPGVYGPAREEWASIGLEAPTV